MAPWAFLMGPTGQPLSIMVQKSLIRAPFWLAHAVPQSSFFYHLSKFDLESGLISYLQGSG